MSLEIKIIGLGKAGKLFFDCLPLKHNLPIKPILIDTDSTCLQEASNCETYLAGKKITYGLPVSDATLASKVVAAERNFLKSLIEKTSIFFVITGSGGYTGITFAKELAKIAYEKNKLMIHFIHLPFYFEGQTKQSISHQNLAQVKQIPHVVIELNNNTVFQKHSEASTAFGSFESFKCIYS